MSRYQYFISYCYRMMDQTTGFSCCVIERDHKITSSRAVQEVIGEIRKDQGFESVTLLNFQRLEE